MRTLASRVLFALPVLIVLGLSGQARAQAHNAWGVGVGVGWGYGPYGYGPVYGFYPTHFPGFYGSGLSMYGPPVPTGKPIPGVFGGGDSTFFDLPPIYPGWMYHGVYNGCAPCAGPAALPPGLVGRVTDLPPPAPVLDQPTPLTVEIRLPRADARLFIDGTEVRGTGTVRHFRTPAVPTAQQFSYDLRAEWAADGLTTTHAKRVLGRAGEKVVADFAR